MNALPTEKADLLRSAVYKLLTARQVLDAASSSVSGLGDSDLTNSLDKLGNEGI